MRVVSKSYGIEELKETGKYSKDICDIITRKKKISDVPGLKSYLLKKFLEIFTVGPVYCNSGKDNDIHAQK